MKKGWLTKKLGEVSTLQRGFDLPTKDRSVGGVPLVTSSGISDRVDKSMVPGPGVATGRSGSIGKVFFIEEDFWPLNTVLYVKDFHGNDPRFVFYLLKKFDLKQFATGAGVPTLNRNFVHDEFVNIPPLSEQQRIVAILDEAFAGLATAKANAEKNLQNARALFESHLQSVFTQRGKGWVEKTLGEVCEVKDGTHNSPKYVSEGIPFVTQKNIREQGLSFEKTKFITQKDHDDFYRRSNAARGDILISMIGANRGMACIVDDSRTFSIKNVGLVKQNKAMNHGFLLYFLKSPQAAGYVQMASKGGAQEFIGLTQLRAWPVPLPPLEQQKSLAEQFVKLATETQRLARLYERKLAALDALKQSLLHQAFSGQL